MRNFSFVMPSGRLQLFQKDGKAQVFYVGKELINLSLSEMVFRLLYQGFGAEQEQEKGVRAQSKSTEHEHKNL